MVIRALLGLLSGVAWGAIAWAIGARALGAAVMAGVYASPAIGLLVAVAFRAWGRLPRPWRVAAALLSLYAAAALFGLAAGLADAARDTDTVVSRRIPHAVVLQTVVGTLWGLTFMGWFVPLWPLAYLNHALLDRLADRRWR